MTRQEQETVINFNEADAEAVVYTHNGALTRKLERLLAERPEEVRRGKSYTDGGMEYIIPKRWVKVNASRILTEAQRRAALESAKAARMAKFAKNS